MMADATRPPLAFPPMPGTVYLVGAGPGDPGLMTRRSLELIARADAILYDRLIPAGALDGARPDAELRYVGKQPGGRSTPQEEITATLMELARAGRDVVRLKGGDPFVLGRGGEEAEALLAAGVPFEVVPGVTSAVAGPAAAGIPVTHRGPATGVTVVTGHGGAGGPDWEGLARTGGTLVILMGVATRAVVADRLMAGGLDPATPVAAVHAATSAHQRTVRTTLAGLGHAEVEPPPVLVVGAVARFDLRWPGEGAAPPG
jgi:uroporphyrin-III C-methyltransferase